MATKKWLMMILKAVVPAASKAVIREEQVCHLLTGAHSVDAFWQPCDSMCDSHGEESQARLNTGKDGKRGLRSK
jgi:hypothetical protein